MLLVVRCYPGGELPQSAGNPIAVPKTKLHTRKWWKMRNKCRLDSRTFAWSARIGRNQQKSGFCRMTSFLRSANGPNLWPSQYPCSRMLSCRKALPHHRHVPVLMRRRFVIFTFKFLFLFQQCYSPSTQQVVRSNISYSPSPSPTPGSPYNRMRFFLCIF